MTTKKPPTPLRMGGFWLTTAPYACGYKNYGKFKALSTASSSMRWDWLDSEERGRLAAALFVAPGHAGIRVVHAQPVGYAEGDAEELEQFAIHDDRTLGDVADAVRQAGLQPVFKDWEAFLGR